MLMLYIENVANIDIIKNIFFKTQNFEWGGTSICTDESDWHSSDQSERVS